LMKWFDQIKLNTHEIRLVESPILSP
jgi:hypothetical protein